MANFNIVTTIPELLEQLKENPTFLSLLARKVATHAAEEYAGRVGMGAYEMYVPKSQLLAALEAAQETDRVSLTLEGAGTEDWGSAPYWNFGLTGVKFQWPSDQVLSWSEEVKPKVYFGFALADSMFANLGWSANIRRRQLSPEDARARVNAGAIPCINPSHAATIAAMRERYGINIEIPQSPPQVSLSEGDRVVVMGVRGLPRLTDRHEYSREEVAAATFSFSEYEVLLKEE